ncbi:MAG: hypothetical protein R3E39_13540 [Anaerolineae bacterium]
MRGITSTFRRVLNDVLAFRNIEAYVIVIIAVGLAVLGVLDDAVPDNWKISAILAGLALLVFQTTNPEHEAPDLDAVLQSRQTMGSFPDRIKGARTLWIYGPSAVNLLRDMPFIKREILEKNGKVRVIIQDPNSQSGMDILHDQMDKTTDLANSIRMSLDILKNASQWGGIEYRLLPYSPGFSMVAVDPDKRDGQIIVEFIGFRNDLITDRMHVEITRSQSQHWFDHWVNQYEAMWNAAHQPES